MNANIVVKFRADTSDIDQKLGRIAKQNSVSGGATSAQYKKANDDRIKSERGLSSSLDQINKERIANDGKYHSLSFKELDKAYTQKHTLIRNMEEQIRRTKDKEEKETLRQSLQNVKFETQSLNKEYKSRDEVSRKGAGAKNGILGTGRNLISQSGVGIGTSLMAGGIAGLAAYGIKESISAFVSYEKALAELSALTGVNGKSLDALGDKARALSKEFGTGLPDAIGAFKLVISALGPDVAKDQSALNEMGRDVLLLAKASGTDATQATASLTNTLNQFGGAALSTGDQAKEMTRIMNVMAAGALQGAAEVPDLAEAMKGVGTVAHTSGISIEETTAAIEILSQNGIKGSEAGVAFKEVLMKMSSGSKEANGALASMGLTFYDINPKINGQEKALSNLKTALDKVKDPVQKAADLEHLFGIRATIGAQILMNNSVAVDGNDSALHKMTAEITGTNTAQEQANKILETTAEKYNRAKAELEDTATSIGQKLVPALGSLLTFLNNSVAGLEKLSTVIRQITFDPTVKMEKNQEKYQQGSKAMLEHVTEMIKSKQMDRNSAYRALAQFAVGAHNELGAPQLDQPMRERISKMVDLVIKESNAVVGDKTKDGSSDIITKAITGGGEDAKNKARIKEQDAARRKYEEDKAKYEGYEEILQKVELDYKLKSLALDLKYNLLDEAAEERHQIKLLEIKTGKYSKTFDIVAENLRLTKSKTQEGRKDYMMANPNGRGFLAASEKETKKPEELPFWLDSGKDTDVEKAQKKAQAITGVFTNSFNSLAQKINGVFFTPFRSALEGSLGVFGSFVSDVIEGLANVLEQSLISSAATALQSGLTSAIVSASMSTIASAAAPAAALVSIASFGAADVLAASGIAGVLALAQAGAAIKLAKGGIVPQYLSSGDNVRGFTGSSGEGVRGFTGSSGEGVRGFTGSSLFAPKGTDTVPAMLTPGEGVLSVEQMKALGGKKGFNQLRRALGQPTGETITFTSSTGAHRMAMGGIVPRYLKDGSHIDESNTITFTSSTGAHTHFQGSNGGAELSGLIQLLDAKLSQLSQPIVIPMPIDSHGVSLSQTRSRSRRSIGALG